MMPSRLGCLLVRCTSSLSLSLERSFSSDHTHSHTNVVCVCPTVMLFISPIPAIPAVMLVVSLTLLWSCFFGVGSLLTLFCGRPSMHSATHWAPSGAAHLGASFPRSLASWVSGPG